MSTTILLKTEQYNIMDLLTLAIGSIGPQAILIIEIYIEPETGPLAITSKAIVTDRFSNFLGAALSDVDKVKKHNR
jgi:hypothetical protein